MGNANIRDNESFGNNSDGFEIIANLFGSVKGTLDISRNQSKEEFSFWSAYQAYQYFLQKWIYLHSTISVIESG